MASTILKRASVYRPMLDGLRLGASSTSCGKLAVGNDVVSAAPDFSSQKPRIWDDAVARNFSTTPLKDLFMGKKMGNSGLPGAFTGVSSPQHVPSYMNNIDKFKAEGIGSVVSMAANGPHVLNGLAEKPLAKIAMELGGNLDKDLYATLLEHRSQRMPGFVKDAKVHALGDLLCDDPTRRGTKHALRPLSPHLPIYKPQINSTFSIFNRISGAFLAGLVVFIPFLSLKMGLICFTYGSFYQFFFYASNFMLITGELAALALAYHVVQGVRHLLADFGGYPFLRFGRKMIR